jgi:hypothetical protein
MLKRKIARKDNCLHQDHLELAQPTKQPDPLAASKSTTKTASEAYLGKTNNKSNLLVQIKLSIL